MASFKADGCNKQVTIYLSIIFFRIRLQTVANKTNVLDLPTVLQ
jgi:hypothetical protein